MFALTIITLLVQLYHYSPVIGHCENTLIGQLFILCGGVIKGYERDIKLLIYQIKQAWASLQEESRGLWLQSLSVLWGLR